MPTTTVFPSQPSRNADAGQVAWTVWQNLRYFASSIFDAFSGKFFQGQAVMTGGTTSIAVPVSVGTPNYQVVVTPLSDPVGRIYITAKSSTGFTINSTTAPGASVTYDYFVKVP